MMPADLAPDDSFGDMPDPDDDAVGLTSILLLELERLMMPAGSASDDNDRFGDLPDPDPDDVRWKSGNLDA